MIAFDRERYVRIQTGALGQAAAIHGAIGECLARGATNIFFLGTGGAAILMHPAAQMLQREGTFPAFAEISAEVVTVDHAQLGPRSIVVVPSLSGTTKETVALARACRAGGAMILALVGHAGTPVAEEAHHAFVNSAEDDTASESFYLQGLLIALSVLHHRREGRDFQTMVEALRLLPPLLADVKTAFDAIAVATAEAWRDEPWHLITAAGNCWPEALYFGMCILEEMQWIRTQSVHAADFFHGPLELVEKGVSVAVLKGEDAYRPLAERVERFARQYTDKTFVLDSASFDLPGFPAAFRPLVSPMVLASALERLSQYLAGLRNHPLSTRRYYKRVPY
ncbi:MAG: SIS domain-containing protein [Rhizobiales bacterium]|nr:SIS domain-containing protein [Hyphomicrobiales bacterium]MBI3674005.1 SIS domain-containing protein [Hyphomicrobiales bacterium]